MASTDAKITKAKGLMWRNDGSEWQDADIQRCQISIGFTLCPFTAQT